MENRQDATEERMITNYTGLYREACGRSFFYLSCPWCGLQVRCSIWSFSGVGKRCPDCGALHEPTGISRKKIEAGHAV